MTITSEIKVVVEATISTGKVDAFKELFQEGIAIIKTKEPETLAYQIYFNSDKSKVYWLEWYKDSQSFLTHLENNRPKLQKMSELAKFTRIEVFGNPSPEAEKAIADFGASIFKYWNGFIR